MTPLHRSTVPSFALMACLTTACSTTAQSQSGRGFPPRPAGRACEERLQRVRTVATPSVKREALTAALTPLYACRPELGRGIAHRSLRFVRRPTRRLRAPHLTAHSSTATQRSFARRRTSRETARPVSSCGLSAFSRCTRRWRPRAHIRRASSSSRRSHSPRNDARSVSQPTRAHPWS